MASFILKVKSNSAQYIIKDLTSNNTVKDLKAHLSNLLSIPVSRIQILYSYPPKVLQVSDENLSLSNTELSSGETIIVKENAETASSDIVVNQPSTIPEDVASIHVYPSVNEVDLSGILLKETVPADNSCLFSSMNYVINRNIDKNKVSWLRRLIAETILIETEQYSPAILGKSNDEYAKWIQNDTSWGGAIELSILSKHYGIEIAVANTISGNINIFGEDKNYDHRVFLLFDGVHYDPLYLENPQDGRIDTIFSSHDNSVLEKANQLLVEAKSSRQFTDMNNLKLKCLDCDVITDGQVMAQQHARLTGHNNFGEIA